MVVSHFYIARHLLCVSNKEPFVIDIPFTKRDKKKPNMLRAHKYH